MRRRPAVFFDRDGTLLELVEYLHRPEQVRLVPGTAAALRCLGEAGWLRVVVTNQSGIARGRFTQNDVEAVHARLRALLRAEGADIDHFEICPHHPDWTGVCSCRKPAGGMLARAAEQLAIDLPRSWIVGDRFDDLEAGFALGVRGALVLTGYGRQEILTAPASSWRFLRFVARDFPTACAFLTGEARLPSPRRSQGGSSPSGQ